MQFENENRQIIDRVYSIRGAIQIVNTPPVKTGGVFTP